MFHAVNLEECGSQEQQNTVTVVAGMETTGLVYTHKKEH